jgi:DNA-binding protein H-NS
MASIDALKKQIAALEAQVERAAKKQSVAVAKVRKIMAEAGLTIEHFAGSAWSAAKKVVATKAAPAAKKKGSKAPKYANPATGVTWTGVGRAPAWIATAKNREDFLISKPAGAVANEAKPAATASKKAVKRVASVKQAMADAAEKKASRKTAKAKKALAKVAVAPAAAKKAVVKKAASVKKAVTAKKPAAAKNAVVAKEATGAPAKKTRAKRAPAATPAAAQDSSAAPAQG